MLGSMTKALISSNLGHSNVLELVLPKLKPTHHAQPACARHTFNRPSTCNKHTMHIAHAHSTQHAHTCNVPCMHMQHTMQITHAHATQHANTRDIPCTCNTPCKSHMRIYHNVRHTGQQVFHFRAMHGTAVAFAGIVLLQDSQRERSRVLHPPAQGCRLPDQAMTSLLLTPHQPKLWA